MIPFAPKAMNDGTDNDRSSNVLLTTKLFIPPTRAGFVLRQHLVDRLYEGLRRKLTLISAPAGFGKTALLSEWINWSKIPAAWIALDTGDNDIIRFLCYAVAALQTIDPAIGKTIGAMLSSLELSHIETLLIALINDTASLPDHFVLVLDDYHIIETQAVHKAVAFLLDHMPPQMHLYITTRSDPPLPIARLRGRGELNELRAVDLRFSPDETTILLKEVMGLAVTSKDVVELTARTEGWIAGLQMAAFSMKDSKDIHGFIQAFTGSNRYILDYLIEEVLQRQPADIQNFLVQTAMLERLAAPLCDVVTGQPGSQAILDQINRTNLFISPLDNEQRWYRYHQLFADLLQQRLRQTKPDLIPAIHHRASLWFEQNGLIAEAVHHALSASDLDRAANLIEDAVQAAWVRGESMTRLDWLKVFPDDMIRARPLLCIYHATLLLFSGGSLSELESRIADAAGGDTAGQLGGELSMLRGVLAMLKGDTQHGIELFHRALELLPERSFFRGSAVRNLSTLYMLTGDVATAETILEKHVQASISSGDPHGASESLRRLGSLCMMRGRLRKAKELYQRALEISVDAKGQPWPIAGRTLYHLGELMFEWNDLEAATRYLTEGIHLLEKLIPTWNVSNYLTLASVKQAQGDAEGAQQAIGLARKLADESETELDNSLVDLCEARLWLAQGKLEAAVLWMEEHHPVTIAMPGVSRRTTEGRELNYPLQEIEQTALARIQLAQGRSDQALELLIPLLDKAERLRRVTSVIEVLALQALAYEAQSNDMEAMKALRMALSLAESEGYIRVFVDAGPTMARLLYKAASSGVAPTYVGRLLAAFSALEPAGSQARREMIEPLTERELEILRLIVAGASNAEIAEQLVISVNTVKKHATNIFGKLAVTTRTQAVARAHALRLFE